MEKKYKVKAIIRNRETGTIEIVKYYEWTKESIERCLQASKSINAENTNHIYSFGVVICQ